MSPWATSMRDTAQVMVPARETTFWSHRPRIDGKTSGSQIFSIISARPIPNAPGVIRMMQRSSNWGCHKQFRVFIEELHRGQQGATL